MELRVSVMGTMMAPEGKHGFRENHQGARTIIGKAKYFEWLKARVTRLFSEKSLTEDQPEDGNHGKAKVKKKKGWAEDTEDHRIDHRRTVKLAKAEHALALR